MAEIAATDTVVLGCSPDDEASHRAFKEKAELNFPLLADTDLGVLKAYDAYGEKTFDGKTSVGVLRKTCLIDKAGTIAKLWNSVKPAGHAEEVLDALQRLG